MGRRRGPELSEERAAYLALTQVSGIGPSRLTALLTAFSTALRAYSASVESLYALPGFTPALVTALKSTPLDSGRNILEHANKAGVDIVIPADASYPELLKNIPDPAPVLFSVGNLDLLCLPAVAIVGSRDHSAYGACCLPASRRCCRTHRDCGSQRHGARFGRYSPHRGT